jgi:hypothetical protein
MTMNADDIKAMLNKSPLYSLAPTEQVVLIE